MIPNDRNQAIPNAARAASPAWTGPTGEASLAHTAQRGPQDPVQTPLNHAAHELPDRVERVNTTLPLVLSILSIFPCCFGFGVVTGGIGVILSVWAIQDQNAGNYRGARRKAVGVYTLVVVHALLCGVAAVTLRIRVH